MTGFKPNSKFDLRPLISVGPTINDDYSDNTKYTSARVVASNKGCQNYKERLRILYIKEKKQIQRELQIELEENKRLEKLKVVACEDKYFGFKNKKNIMKKLMVK